MQLGYLSPKVEIRMVCELLVPIMTGCIKNQQTKKHFFAPNQKGAKKLIDLLRQSPGGVQQKGCSSKFREIHLSTCIGVS